MVQLGPFFRKDDFAAVGGRLVADAGEEAGEGVVILLAPFVRRMMVALGALNADAQKQLAERSAQVLRRGEHLVNGGRPLAGGVATGGDNRADPFVVGPILRELLAQPPRVVATAPAGVSASRSTRRTSAHRIAQKSAYSGHS